MIYSGYDDITQLRLKDLKASPPLARSSITHASFFRTPPRTRAAAPWAQTALLRRSLFLALVAIPSFYAYRAVSIVFSTNGITFVERILIDIYTLLVVWLCVCSWTNIMGFFVLARGKDHFNFDGDPGDDAAPVREDSRTAVVMTISNERVSGIFSRLRTTYLSLKNTGLIERFEFFVLSDTTDPDIWVAEEAAWAELCRQTEGYGRIFYRHRRIHRKHKPGNIGDFLRRWGRRYACMMLMDADSLVSGDLLVRLVRIMESRPEIGMLQTEPRAFNQTTLLSRIQQFAVHLYAPLTMAGLNFLQLGDAESWGHNVLIRVAPFMKYCNLPGLSRVLPLGGEILSHDFVEAALMRRAGWEVWLAYGLKGSYEEIPPTLLEELRRDRRWCRGNIQHLRLLFSRGLTGAHRALFIHGIMHYASAFFWFLFLTLGTVALAAETYYKPVYFPAGKSLFPEWPVYHKGLSLILFAATISFLMLPKFLSVALVLARRAAGSFGGALRLVRNVFAEILLSFFLAPVKMVSHAYYVVLALIGKSMPWGIPLRASEHTGWLDALRAHGLGTLLGIAWGISVYSLNRSFFWWTLPIILPLVLAVPISVISSYEDLGIFFRSPGFFRMPGEALPSRETVYPEAPLAFPQETGFSRALSDPAVLAVHLLLVGAERRFAPRIDRQLQDIEDKLVAGGARALTPLEKMRLLHDPARLRRLHSKMAASQDVKKED